MKTCLAVLGGLVGLAWTAHNPARAQEVFGPPDGKHPYLTVSGRVVDVNGNPVPGAVVGINPGNPVQGYSGPAVAFVKTDWRGWFTVRVPKSAFPNDELTVQARKGAQTFEGGGGVVFDPQFATSLPPSLVWPSACDAPNPPGHCGEVLVSAGCPTAGPGAGSNICNPNWPPSAPAASGPELSPGVPPNWFHLSLDPNGFGGSREATTRGPAADGGPFASSGGGQSR